MAEACYGMLYQPGTPCGPEGVPENHTGDEQLII